MACPIRAILNPVNHSIQTNPVPSIGDEDEDEHDDDDDATISEASTEIMDEGMSSNALIKHRKGLLNTESANEDSTNRVIVSPAILSHFLCPNSLLVPGLPTPPRIANDPQPRLHESKSKIFSIFNALLKYPELTLELSKHFDVNNLISLYAISKEFHFLVNGRFTAMILGQSNAKAPESSKTFIFRCYKSLCMRDPARRVNETKPDELRFIPSFRWLRMILFREAVVDDVLQSLSGEGHRLPKRTRLTIKKIWFTMDISDNARRIGLMHNTTFWSNKDLFLATMFFFKLDMRLTHPTAGNGEIGLRKMLLGQRSLSMLAKVLRREEMRTQVDLLRMIVRFNYEPPQHRHMDIMGIPSHEIGRLQYEGWGARHTKFIQIDELVMREAVKRKLNLQHFYVDMIIYGFIDNKTFQDVRTPMLKHEDEAEVDGEDYTSSDEDEDEDVDKEAGRGVAVEVREDVEMEVIDRQSRASLFTAS